MIRSTCRIRFNPYMKKDRLLRPSLVGVSKKSVNKDEKDQEIKENSENK